MFSVEVERIEITLYNSRVVKYQNLYRSEGNDQTKTAV
jgi:hypothetical protein